MPLEVHTDDLVRAGAALRDLGDRVSSYGERLDRRVATVAREVDGDVGDALMRAAANAGAPTPRQEKGPPKRA